MHISTIKWTRLFGTTANESPLSVSTATDGSVYIAGYTEGDLDGEANNGQADAFLSKYDSNGSRVWTSLLGTSNNDWGFSVSTANDGSVYIAGDTTGDIGGEDNVNSPESNVFLSKFDSNGSKAWTKLILSSRGGVGSVHAGADGSIYIAGKKQNSESYYDAFVSKLSSDGSEIWTKLIASERYRAHYDGIATYGPAHDFGNSVSTAADGSVYVTGYSLGARLDGQALSVQDTATAFLIKYDSDGSKAWTRVIESNPGISGGGNSYAQRESQFPLALMDPSMWLAREVALS